MSRRATIANASVEGLSSQSNGSTNPTTPVKNRMQSNIFGVDPTIKTEYKRTGIGSGGDVDIKFDAFRKNNVSSDTSNSNKPYFDAYAKDRLLIHNASVFNYDEALENQSILLEAGKIVKMSDGIIEVPNDTPKIDATGMSVLPGGVDCGSLMHWDPVEASMAALKGVTQHAARGGTTTVVETVMCPVNKCPVEHMRAFFNIVDKTKNAFWCDLSVNVGLFNLDGITVNDKMPVLVNELGINQFVGEFKRLHMNYFPLLNEQAADSQSSAHNIEKPMVFVQWDESGTALHGTSITPEQLRMGMSRAKSLGAVMVVHVDCAPHSHDQNGNEHGENKASSDCSSHDKAKNELYTVKQVAQMCCETSCPTVLSSLSSHLSVDLVAHAKHDKPRLPLWCTVDTQTLLNSDKCCELWHCLAADEVLCLTSNQKLCSSDSSMNTYPIAQRLAKSWPKAMMKGSLTESAFVGITSVAASQFVGLFPSKGRISEGCDADIMMWSEASQMSVDSAMCPSVVIMGGEVVARHGEITAPQANGLLMRTKAKPGLPFQYSKAAQKSMHTLCLTVDIDKLCQCYPKSNGNTDQVQNKADEHKQQQEEAVLRPQTGRRGARRDMHESSFSLSGAQNDEHNMKRTSIRTTMPPGGGHDTRLW